MGSFKEMPVVGQIDEHASALEVWINKLEAARQQGDVLEAARINEIISKIPVDKKRYGNA